MELCPYCKERVSLHVGKYRCSRCHIWLKREECLEEVKHNFIAAECDAICRGTRRAIKVNPLPR